MKYSKVEHFKVSGTETRGSREVIIGEFFCVVNGKTYSTLGGVRNAIRPKFGTVKAFYDEYYKTEVEGICEVCGSTDCGFVSILDGYRHFCSPMCFSKTNRAVMGQMEKYHNNPEKVSVAKEKARLTQSQKSEEQLRSERQMGKDTLLRLYGESYLSDRTTAQWANKTVEERKDIGAKGVKTKTRNGTLNSNTSERYKKKTIMICDKSFQYQGYEDAVLKFLIVDMNISPDLIVSGNDVPKIPCDVNVTGIYHPDIYIAHLNLIIEVKSDWTLYASPDVTKNNRDKQLSTLNAGYDHIIFSMKSVTKDRELKQSDKTVFTEYLNMTISSQALSLRLKEKVQRLSGDSEYGPIAIGSGSARGPK